jgi:hypothetical protein
VRTKTGGTKRAEPARGTKERVTFQLPVALIERAPDVVFFSPGLTMASFMEEALVAQLKRAEKKRGGPFPSRAGATLKTGRPVKAAQCRPTARLYVLNDRHDGAWASALAPRPHASRTSTPKGR